MLWCDIPSLPSIKICIDQRQTMGMPWHNVKSVISVRRLAVHLWHCIILLWRKVLPSLTAIIIHQPLLYLLQGSLAKIALLWLQWIHQLKGPRCIVRNNWEVCCLCIAGMQQVLPLCFPWGSLERQMMTGISVGVRPSRVHALAWSSCRCCIFPLMTWHLLSGVCMIKWPNVWALIWAGARPLREINYPLEGSERPADPVARAS